MPTPYVKQTWIDGVAGGTPISAARLTYIEDGIENATVEDGTYVDTTTDQRSAGVKTFAEVRVSGGRPWHDVRDVIRNVAPGADVSAAINAVIASGGVGLAIPPNTALDVGAALTPGNNTQIEFFGPTSSLVRMTNTAYPLIQATGATGVKVYGGGKMTGTATSNVSGAMGVQFRGCTDSGVEDIEISGQPGDGIGFDTSAATRCWARRNKVHDNKGHGIQFTLGDDMAVEFNEVWSQTAGNAYVLGYAASGTSRRPRLIGNRADTAGISAYQLSGLEGGQFIGNRSKGIPHGLISDSCSDLLIALNSFRDMFTTSAIGSAMFLASMTDCTVALNRFRNVTTGGGGNGYGIRILSTSSGLSVVQNRIEDCGSTCIRAEGPDMDISGNRVLRGGVGPGIALWGSLRAIVTGNLIRDCAATGIQLGNGPNGSHVYGNDISNPAVAGSSPTAIDVLANTASCRIYGNSIHDWGAGTRIAKSGTGTSTTFVRDDQLGADAPTYAVTNAVTDRAYDANATTVEELADVVATLIADLRLSGTVK